MVFSLEEEIWKIVHTRQIIKHGGVLRLGQTAHIFVEIGGHIDRPFDAQGVLEGGELRQFSMAVLILGRLGALFETFVEVSDP